jgi:hypothetical protein
LSADLFAPAGRCQFCGCTEDNACRLATGETCWWVYRQRNLCSRPECLQRYRDELRKEQKRRLTSAEVHALIKRRKKPVKRPLKPARGKR